MSQYPLLRKIVIAAVFLLIGLILYIYSSLFMPILLALLTAIMFEPLVRLLQRYLRTEKRLVAVTIVFTIFILICSVTVYFTVTYFINQVINFIYRLPQYAVQIQRFVDSWIDNFNVMIANIPQNHLLIEELEYQIQLLTDRAYEAAQDVIPVLTGWVQAIPNFLFVVLVYMIMLFLISLDLPRISTMFYSIFKDETALKIKYVFQRLGKVFWGYWKAQLLLSILIFALTYVSLLFIAPELALFMSVIIWVIDIIPLYVGPAIVLVPWAIYAYIIGNPALGTQLMILAIGLLIIRRILEPKVLGDHMGLSALSTVLSMYFGFYFFGVIGLILGPFVTIAIRSAMEAELFKINFKI